MSTVGYLEPFDSKRFLADYWQRRPCLIRGWLGPEPLGLDRLLDLAEDRGLPSRLVTGSQARADWTLTHGPLSAEELPGKERHWTVLVQEVDKACPEVAAVLDPFRAFLPDWMIDDVMISQAVDGGSVGAHVDAYDVFLVQVDGQRRWQLAAEFDPTPDRRFELALLENWKAQTELKVGPGDVLYLPAGIAHHGIAQGECQTWSVGLRTPSAPELLFSLADSLALDDGDRPRLGVEHPDPDSPARITPEVVTGAQRILEQALQIDDAGFRDLLGKFLTGWRLWQDDREMPQREEIENHLASGPVDLDPATRLATSGAGDRFRLYVNGEVVACSEKLGRDLVETRRLHPAWKDHPEWLEQLLETGAVAGNVHS